MPGAAGVGARTERASCRVTVIIPPVTGLSVSTVPSGGNAGGGWLGEAGHAPSSRSGATTASGTDRPDELVLRSYRPFQLSAQLGAVTNLPRGTRRGGPSLDDVRLVVTGGKAATSASDAAGAPVAGTAITLADLAERSVSLDQDALLAQVRVEMPETVAAKPGFTAEVIVTIWQFQ